MIRVTFYLFNPDFLSWHLGTVNHYYFGFGNSICRLYVGIQRAAVEKAVGIFYRKPSILRYFWYYDFNPQGLSGALLQVIFHAIAKMRCSLLQALSFIKQALFM